MKVLIQAKKSAADAHVQAYAQGKLERLTRHNDQILEARMELGTEKNKSLETMKVAQLVVHVNGTILKAQQAAEHMNEAIDLVIDKMDRQIRHHKEKLQDHRRTKVGAGKLAAAPAASPRPLRSTPDAGLARTKRFRLKPIAREQAQAEMEALGHAFFVFLNEDSQEVNVLYRRKNGSHGLLEVDLG